jgi:hypothetical protein
LMTEKSNKQADKIAALERELAEVKAAQDKAKPIDWAAEERATREYMSQMHDMRERRMSLATPPSVIRDFADGVSEANCRAIAATARAPTGPTTMAPSSPPVTGVRSGGGNVPGSGSGWAREIPLSSPPGVAQADRLMDAQDAKDKAERIREAAQLRAMDRLDALHAKLAEQKK